MKEQKQSESDKNKSYRGSMRRYTHADLEAVCQLVKDVWDEAAAVRVRKRYHWQFYENPLMPSDGPAILVMEKDNRVVALVCGLPCMLKVGDANVESQWVVDYMVHPRHRGIHGSILTNEIKKLSRITLGFPVANSLRIWRRAGGEPLETSIGYSRILNFKEVFGKKKWPPLVYGIGGFLTACFNQWLDLRSRGNSTCCDIDKIDHFNPSFDELLSSFFSMRQNRA